MRRRLTFEIAAIVGDPRRLFMHRYYVEVRRFSWLFDLNTSDADLYGAAQRIRRDVDQHVNDPLYFMKKAAPYRQ